MARVMNFHSKRSEILIFANVNDDTEKLSSVKLFESFEFGEFSKLLSSTSNKLS